MYNNFRFLSSKRDKILPNSFEQNLISIEISMINRIVLRIVLLEIKNLYIYIRIKKVI